MNKPPGIPGEVRCGFFQEFVLHAEFAKFALGLGQLDPLMRGERGLVAGVVAAVLVYPVAECSLVHAELSCDLGDRAGSVDHKSHGFVPELGTELAVLPCHSLHHLPGHILLDGGPRTTGRLSSWTRGGLRSWCDGSCVGLLVGVRGLVAAPRNPRQGAACPRVVRRARSA